jgi:hypothetical protein
MINRLKNIIPLPVLIMVAMMLIQALTSCKEDIEAPPGKRIPERVFISILTEIGLADGLLTVPRVRDSFIRKDSVSTYTDIIVNHGYTKEDLDFTFRDYYLNKSKKLIKIYDRIIAKLTEMESHAMSIPIDESPNARSVWPGETLIFFPDTLPDNHGDFSVQLYPPGYFTLNFTLTLYPSDQTNNPCISIWYTHADSAETGRKRFFRSVKYFRDGVPRTYAVAGEINEKFPAILHGRLIDYENNPASAEMAAKIEDITLFFSPHP